MTDRVLVVLRPDGEVYQVVVPTPGTRLTDASWCPKGHSRVYLRRREYAEKYAHPDGTPDIAALREVAAK